MRAVVDHDMRRRTCGRCTCTRSRSARYGVQTCGGREACTADLCGRVTLSATGGACGVRDSVLFVCFKTVHQTYWTLPGGPKTFGQHKYALTHLRHVIDVHLMFYP